MSDQRITFSPYSILSILIVVLLLFLLWQVRSLLVILMISVVLAATISPIVNWAEKFQVPRWLAVAAIYLTFLIGFAGIGLLIGPSVVQQTERLVSRIPVYSENLYTWVQEMIYRINAEQADFITQFVDLQALARWTIQSTQQVVLKSVGLTRGLVGASFSTVLAVLMSGYMVAGSKNLLEGLVQLFPYPWDKRLLAQVKPVSQRMGGFIQGRVVVSFILCIVTIAGLSILGLSEFALALGVIAGFTNLIPFVGPILGAIPAFIVALSAGGLTWLWVVLLFAIVQNLESYVLDPLLVGSSVNLNPLYQLLAVIGGTQVLGILGALIVPPWVAGAGVLLENLYLQPKRFAELQAEAELGEEADDGALAVSVAEGVGGRR